MLSDAICDIIGVAIGLAIGWLIVHHVGVETLSGLLFATSPLFKSRLIKTTNWVLLTGGAAAYIYIWIWAAT